jgi:hypothetical protein
MEAVLSMEGFMKFFIASSLLLALAAYAQLGTMGTPTGTGAGSGALNTNITETAPTLEPTPLPANPSVNPIPEINPDGSVYNNSTIGPYYPANPNPNQRQAQEAKPAPLPNQPSAFPPVNNPGQPANVDGNGRPIIP